MYKLVIIDDEYCNLEGMREIIEWKKYNVKIVGEALNGKEGLKVVAEKNPDILIVDICMGDMDGLDMIEQLRKNGYWGKIIILSGYQFFEYAQRSIDLKVEKYLTKPINIATLEETIASITETGNWEKNENANFVKESSSIVKDIIAEIDKNYTGNINLGAFAQKYYCTPAYISKIFKKHTGVNFVDYISKKRIEKAKEWLLQSDFKSEEIAWRVGYADVKHYRDVFKKIEGMSPKEYRKNPPAQRYERLE